MVQLIVTGFLLGVGLAMDACAASMTNGLNEPNMRTGKAIGIAGTFAVFQALMPMIGYLCVTLVAEKFAAFAKWIPYAALVLLMIVGGKMLFDGIKHNDKAKCGKEEQENSPAAKPLTFAALILQAVATSIDALSTGFTLNDVAGSQWYRAVVAVGIIGVVTFALSLAGVFVGKKFGDRLGCKAEIVGGVILICIGIEIFVTGVFF